MSLSAHLITLSLLGKGGGGTKGRHFLKGEMRKQKINKEKQITHSPQNDDDDDSVRSHECI